MPRPSKTAPGSLAPSTLILDNGGYTIKAGFSSPSPSPSDCSIVPNCIARDSDRNVWVGSQLDQQCRDFRELAFRRPVERGFVVNWEGERAVWGREFCSGEGVLKCDPHETNLIVTEAPNCPVALQANCDQIVFEEFEFASYARCIAPILNAYNDIAKLFGDEPAGTESPIKPAECLLVVDSGYSHTTITPLLNGRPIQKAIRRLSVGGKFLTNFMKEQLSIRHINLMDETYVVDEMKEAVTFVSADFPRDLDAVWTRGKHSAPRHDDPSIVVDYVLPDYETTFRGIMRPHDAVAAKDALRAPQPRERETVVTLTNERFSGPELLFRPSDVGLQEGGLPEVILQSLEAVAEGVRPGMLANILVVGGNARIPGMVARLERELRQIAPAECTVRVRSPEDPIRSTWLGGARLASQRSLLRELVVTRAEYEEHGVHWVGRKFAQQSLQ